ncbi:MAG TPA: hypothetical protein VIG57_03415, partial [Candidatus Entotheonella sp.]
MPALSFGFFLVASHLRIVRSTMLEVLESDYINMVRANSGSYHEHLTPELGRVLPSLLRRISTVNYQLRTRH